MMNFEELKKYDDSRFNETISFEPDLPASKDAPSQPAGFTISIKSLKNPEVQSKVVPLLNKSSELSRKRDALTKASESQACAGYIKQQEATDLAICMLMVVSIDGLEGFDNDIETLMANHYWLRIQVVAKAMEMSAFYQDSKKS